MLQFHRKKPKIGMRISPNKEAIFYSNMSAYNATTYHYDNSGKISAMLQYILCASRFAHYIKIIGRNKIGSLSTAQECSTLLNNWLKNKAI